MGSVDSNENVWVVASNTTCPGKAVPSARVAVYWMALVQLAGVHVGSVKVRFC